MKKELKVIAVVLAGIIVFLAGFGLGTSKGITIDVKVDGASSSASASASGTVTPAPTPAPSPAPSETNARRKVQRLPLPLRTAATPQSRLTATPVLRPQFPPTRRKLPQSITKLSTRSSSRRTLVLKRSVQLTLSVLTAQQVSLRVLLIQFLKAS